MNSTIRFMLLFLLAFMSANAYSEERQKVCARYETQDGMSKSYLVEAIITDGSELNQETSSFNYSNYSTYVVIFWAPDQASVIEMNFGGITGLPSQGKDQDGRTWEIYAAPGYCL